MARTERTEPAATTPEQTTHALHRYLALGIGAGAGLLFLLRGPASEQAARDATAVAARAEPTRAELDAAIARLAAWVESTSRAPRTPLETNQRLLALGRGALEGDAAAIAASLERLMAPRASVAAPVPAALSADPSPPGAARSSAVRDASAAATLAILLEAGTPLERELPLSKGPVRVAELLDRALPEALSRPGDTDPWALDLLSFALLAGKPEPRDALASRVHASLLLLERALRAPALPPAVEGGRAWLEALELGPSVFRAIAVLAEDDLRERGLRCASALVQRMGVERGRWRERLGQARSEPERLLVHLEALEALGQFEQTLFGAHLAFRRGEGAEPAARTASSMRRAAGDLLDHLATLERTKVFADGATGEPRLERSRAAARALRGLRAARIAL